MAGGGGSEPNLTPLIDLFSVLIVFLLLTAVLTQLEAFQVTFDTPKASENEINTSNDPPPKKDTYSIEIFKEFLVAKRNSEENRFDYSALEDRQSSFVQLILSWKNQAQESDNITINTNPGSTYGQLIKVYDTLYINGWQQIVINPN